MDGRHHALCMNVLRLPRDADYPRRYSESTGEWSVETLRHHYTHGFYGVLGKVIADLEGPVARSPCGPRRGGVFRSAAIGFEGARDTGR